MTNTIKIFIAFSALAGGALASASDKVVVLKPGTAEYHEIVHEALPTLHKKPSIKVGRTLDAVQRVGNYALVFDRLNNKTAKGKRIEWACVLHRSANGRWNWARAKVGVSALRNIANPAETVPRQLFNVPRSRSM